MPPLRLKGGVESSLTSAAAREVTANHRAIKLLLLGQPGAVLVRT